MLKEILEKYGINSFKAKAISNGLINKTYLVTTNNNKYILQRLNPIYETGVLNDINNITKYVNKNEKIIPRLIKTITGKIFVLDNKNIWRLYEYVDGDVYLSTEDSSVVYEAGRMLGKFHNYLKSYSRKFKSKLPVAHQSEKIFQRFLETINKNPESDRVINRYRIQITQMRGLFFKKAVTESVTHGDPKISNFIFSNKKAVSIIDLDGCNINKVLIELGDAMRSWCGDTEDSEKNKFDLKKFRYSLSGYIETSNFTLPKKEFYLIPQAVKLATIELASKFLRDYYNDTYFDWDKKRYASRRQHNLARTKSQLSLFQDIKHKEEKMLKIIDKLIKILEPKKL